ncbi:hypothetical protein LINPERPRIM_LOCUS30676 [Linum perenne]
MLLLIYSCFENDSRHNLTIHNIAALRNRKWETTVSHIFKEGNKIVDLLAHHGHSIELGTHFNCLYPSEVDRTI